jgi:hypothetical protein
MEAHRRMEFTSGVELAALVEKIAAGPVEKVAVDREARWSGRKTGCRALAWRRCRRAEQRRDGEGGAVEREAQWRARSPRRCGGASRCAAVR